ncbi:MAG: hypothetical protein U9Q34_08085 [Elusimicrobiota bacterium]|nr:hypothetical protein [Elusimicrobiota bacterium]
MRTFIGLREILVSNKKLREKMELMEKKYDNQFKVVFNAIRQIITPPCPPHSIGGSASRKKPKKRTNFTAKEKRARYLARK